MVKNLRYPLVTAPMAAGRAGLRLTRGFVRGFGRAVGLGAYVQKPAEGLSGAAGTALGYISGTAARTVGALSGAATRLGIRLASRAGVAAAETAAEVASRVAGPVRATGGFASRLVTLESGSPRLTRLGLATGVGLAGVTGYQSWASAVRERHTAEIPPGVVELPSAMAEGARYRDRDLLNAEGDLVLALHNLRHGGMF